MSSIHSKEYRSLIDRLIQARKAAGMTQLQVATALKKPQSYISKVENYQRRVDVLELKTFAALYGVAIEELLNG